jgi:hypothetical protein
LNITDTVENPGDGGAVGAVHGLQEQIRGAKARLNQNAAGLVGRELYGLRLQQGAGKQSKYQDTRAGHLPHNPSHIVHFPEYP